MTALTGKLQKPAGLLDFVVLRHRVLQSLHEILAQNPDCVHGVTKGQNCVDLAKVKVTYFATTARKKTAQRTNGNNIKAGSYSAKSSTESVRQINVRLTSD